jgi:hypothetical protein
VSLLTERVTQKKSAAINIPLRRSLLANKVIATVRWRALATTECDNSCATIDAKKRRAVAIPRDATQLNLRFHDVPFSRGLDGVREVNGVQRQKGDF